MTHLLWWQELHHLLRVQTQNRRLVLVGSVTGVQLSDTLSHQQTLLHRLIEHVLVRGYSGMVLPDTVVLDHLLQSCVEALGAQPVTPLALQLLLSLVQLGFQWDSESSLVHMLCQGGQEFTELRVLGQILLCNVTQGEGGENLLVQTVTVPKRKLRFSGHFQLYCVSF